MLFLQLLNLNATHFPYAHLADKRTQKWLLVESFGDVLALVTLYLLLVRYLPRWMERWDKHTHSKAKLKQQKQYKKTPLL